MLAAALVKGGTRPAGIGAEPNINAGFKVAVDLGATVLNLSFGTPSRTQPGRAQAAGGRRRYAARYGCVLVAASGNSGAAERYYPAALPEVIAVGSVGSDGRRSKFSSYGDHVALSAPGERIVSCGLRGLREGSGTSYAAPFVTGAAALLVARARKRGRTLAPREVRRLLVSSTMPLPGAPAAEVGSGLLDVEAALRQLDAEAES